MKQGIGMRRGCLLGAGWLAAGSVAAMADISVVALPSNTPYGYAPATVFSGDGGTAGGTHRDNYLPPTGVRWNSQGQASLASMSVVTAFSYDASAVGGTAYIFVMPKLYREQAAIWHSGSGPEYIPLPSGSYGSEGGLMDSGGNTMIVNGDLVWRRGQGYVATITGTNTLRAMSGDGSTVVGRTSSSFAARWTPTGGLQVIQVPGAANSDAYAVSPDGSEIVGTMSTSGQSHAFIWDAQNGGRILTSLSGPALDVAAGISADGSVIVGSSNLGSTTQPVIWTPSGSSLLSDILHGAGIHDLDSFAHLQAAAVSTDGTRLLVNDFGMGNGQWIVTIPGPGTIAVLGVGSLLARRRLRN
jgi:hypothetical protein